MLFISDLSVEWEKEEKYIPPPSPQRILSYLLMFFLLFKSQ